MADLTHLDLKQLQMFHDEDVATALKTARTYRDETVDGIRPLGDIVDGHTTPENPDKAQQVLRIGLMAGGDLVSGQSLIQSITTAATAIDTLLGEQEVFFKELKEALQDTLDKMAETKQTNLDSIDAQTLLQLFSEVDTGVVGSTSGGGGDED
ncbi:type VII secretion system-associated protein [Streptomyces sp. NPDC006267]|uniref:type VII secretion system-associated protein n=1 Tax=unclassified Streptomyces TaxID=2593676 RepID=UPI0033AACD82